jgi:hypothetical protein
VSIFSSGRIKQPLKNSIFCSGCLRRPLLKLDRSAPLFSDQSRASKSDTQIVCFLIARCHARSLKQDHFSLSRGSLPSILSLFHSLSLFSHSLLIWRPPFSPDLEAVRLETNVAPGSRAGGRHRAGQLGSYLASLSLSLHYDVRRGSGGGTTAGRGSRLFPPKATEVVEWVLRHFFPPNATQVMRPCCSWTQTRPRRRRTRPTSSTTPGTSACGHKSMTPSSRRCGFGFHNHDSEQQRQPDGGGLGSRPGLFFSKFDFSCQ